MCNPFKNCCATVTHCCCLEIKLSCCSPAQPWPSPCMSFGFCGCIKGDDQGGCCRFGLFDTESKDSGQDCGCAGGQEEYTNVRCHRAGRARGPIHELCLRVSVGRLMCARL